MTTAHDKLRHTAFGVRAVIDLTRVEQQLLLSEFDALTAERDEAVRLREVYRAAMYNNEQVAGQYLAERDALAAQLAEAQKDNAVLRKSLADLAKVVAKQAIDAIDASAADHAVAEAAERWAEAERRRCERSAHSTTLLAALDARRGGK